MMNTRVEMNDEMMAQVSGCGTMEMDTFEYRAYSNEQHLGCGGHIKNHYIPFVECVCERCGEHHPYYADFFKHAALI